MIKFSIILHSAAAEYRIVLWKVYTYYRISLYG